MFEAGVFLIDKPRGPSSFRMVQLVRRALGLKKVGHTGTLDPFASGLLIICAGRPATRIISRLMEGEKCYEATLRLGVETDTLDIEGKVVAKREVDELNPDVVRGVVAGFVGEQLQTPPQFSALKHKGKPLYHYARKGIKVEKEPRKVFIRRLDIVDFSGTSLTVRVTCGKGTYIRSLAADIGTALGCGAHLSALRRLANGPFSVERALDGKLLEGERGAAREMLLSQVLSVEEALERLPNNG